MKNWALITLLVGLCLVVGCAKNETAEVAQLRDAVGQLRKEVAQLRKDVHEMKVRAERRVPGPARPVDVQRMRGMSGNASRVATAETDARTHGTHAPKSQAAARPSSPTIEELKARHETMRDPAQREKMRAEHRARMEERRQRMEERRRQYLERHAGEASSAAKNAVSSSDSK